MRARDAKLSCTLCDFHYLLTLNQLRDSLSFLVSTLFPWFSNPSHWQRDINSWQSWLQGYWTVSLTRQLNGRLTGPMTCNRFTTLYLVIFVTDTWFKSDGNVCNMWYNVCVELTVECFQKRMISWRLSAGLKRKCSLHSFQSTDIVPSTSILEDKGSN